MTLNKFEKEIREKLQGREIKPSGDAWDKVSASLDAAGKPKRFPYFRYAVAAGFIGFLFLSVLYFQEKDIPAGDLKIGGDPVEKTPTLREKEDQMELLERERDATVTDSGGLPVSAGHNSDQPSPQPSQPQKALAVRVPDTSGAAVENRIPERLIETKLEEVVADIRQMEQGGQTISDLEVDSLLRQAQDELLASQSDVSSSVNATALLREVEDELDESFREKLFNKLQEGFQKVRTAVADRNN